MAALPLMAVGRPLDAALLAPWLLAAVGLGLGAFWRVQLRRGRELVARACHELRGPLTAAHLALHAGARRGDAPPARVAAIERELDRAALALEDLAAARRGRRAPDRDEPVDVGDLLAYQALHVADGRAASSAAGVELVEPRSGAMVRGDRVRLAQAVGNLVANALEHGDGRVRLRGARAGRPGAHRGRRRGPGPAGAGGRPDAPPARRARAPRARPGHRGRHRRSPRRPAGGGAGARAARASPSSCRRWRDRGVGRDAPPAGRRAARAWRCCSACSPPRTSPGARRRCAASSGRRCRSSSCARRCGRAQRIARAALARARGARALRAAGRAARSAAPPSGQRAAVAIAAAHRSRRRRCSAVPGGRRRRAVPSLRRGERALDLVAVGAADAVVRGRARRRARDPTTGAPGAPAPTRLALADVEVLAARPRAADRRRADVAGGLPRLLATLRVTVRQAVALTAAAAAAREQVRLLPRPRALKRTLGGAIGHPSSAACARSRHRRPAPIARPV